MFVLAVLGFGTWRGAQAILWSADDPPPDRDAKGHNGGPHYCPEQNANGNPTRPTRRLLMLSIAQFDRHGRVPHTHRACVFIEATHFGPLPGDF
jgi:hypothetical protein